MRVMVMIKATSESEAEVQPSEEIFTEMGRFNEELVNAGVMLAGEGLHPSARGARVRLGDGPPSITDGPFAETKELVAGFWIWKVESVQDAIAWVKRMPAAQGVPYDVEIRPIYEVEDFGEGFTPELQAQEEALRARIAEQSA